MILYNRRKINNNGKGKQIEMLKSIVTLSIILILIIHIIGKYKQAKTTGEKFSSLIGGKFTFVVLILLLLNILFL